jgi:undecaprenyl-diphosphatase
VRAFCTNLILWDENFLNIIFRLKQYRLVDRIVPAISRSGDGYLYPLVALLFWLMDRRLGALLFFSALVAFGIELPLYKLIKHVVRRSRPCDALGFIEGRIPIADRFSFPSGHTAAAFVMAIVVNAFHPALSPVMYSWAGLVGFSRIYLGVHYPTDVLAGMVVGICCGVTGTSIVM